MERQSGFLSVSCSSCAENVPPPTGPARVSTILTLVFLSLFCLRLYPSHTRSSAASASKYVETKESQLLLSNHLLECSAWSRMMKHGLNTHWFIPWSSQHSSVQPYLCCFKVCFHFLINILCFTAMQNCCPNVRFHNASPLKLLYSWLEILFCWMLLWLWES